MTSGAHVDEDVKEIFNKMKVPKKDEDRIRVVALHIDEDIKVEKIYTQKELGDQCAFTFLKSLMKPDCCRYYLYDCRFETKEQLKKEELVFILWAPADAGCRSRMKYASSKSAVDKVFNGVKHNKQVNEITDMDLETFASDLGVKIGAEIRSVEGRDCCHFSHQHQHQHRH